MLGQPFHHQEWRVDAKVIWQFVERVDDDAKR
jgi:hypothetical protein